MIQVIEALAIVEANSSKMPGKRIPLGKALCYVLAETVYSHTATPAFRQSAIDGYAFVYSEKQQYDIVGSLQAGEHLNTKLENNQTVRVFPGAFLPDGADTVVTHDYVMSNEKSILITVMPDQFDNIHENVEQIDKIDKNEVVIEANTLITPASIGLLSGLGITEVTVYKKPKIALLVMENELVKTDEKFLKDKIYESNSLMLQAALQTIGIKKTKVFGVKNNFKVIKKALKNSLSKYDIVLISGGVSAGDFDTVKEVLLENEVKELFYKINQKPEGLLFFGKKEETLVFTLSGNPASLLTNFYVYVCPAIKNKMGFGEIYVPKVIRKLNSEITNTSGKTVFLKGLYDETFVTVLEDNSLLLLDTFAKANSVLMVPYNVENVKKGESVALLPIN
ncbi:molybdopterin molybdotransferase MoeA [Flavobacterium sp. Fl-77]|uniref:Molybdopterin molybdenumtransferase n=1 Tax=Flavobacterium flavipigmentatum TaxID=2893884 RepID=A0AAJ2SF53_9FLAO|nr:MULTISPECIES: molybdopterin molybdotransferase MoeA [unclassified Flavobacterium]MDX6183413.1 molybdopterin molybdotransferase MoeA [Flavobacterium sp. Fl-33]MDX6186697.1 molybdopterin molybdotransferase MoeA [Flavobacterium sp. Fl-77]UFH38535.1 molybdopterin molybdotransferase MoeA [Flavobacterium sp. F-70]